MTAPFISGQTSPGQPGWWVPPRQVSWQWQLTGTLDMTVDAEVFDIDLFDHSASVVEALHQRGRKVICYVSVGTFEPWRPDAGSFPTAVKGKRLEDFADEQWLDVRRLDVLGPIMEARLDLCKAKGFDAVEPDNVDAYDNDSGFPLTAADQLRYNRFIADAAHARGLSVGLKNDLDQVRDLLPHFDWALNEQCFQYRECNALLPFVNAGKAVFHVEYRLTPDRFCAEANALGFNSLHKNVSLDAYRTPCRAASAAPPELRALTSAASYAGGAVAPGEIVAAFGAEMGPAVAALARLTPNGIVDSVLDGTRLLFDDVPSPMLYAQAGQVLAVAPFRLAARTPVRVELERNGRRSAPLSVAVAEARPGIFTADASGRGQAAALNENGSLNGPANGARPGSILVLYLTGGGLTEPLVADGAIVGAPLPRMALPVTVRVGGQAAEVLYWGCAPGQVAGLYQLNVRLPAAVAPGAAVPVEVQVGGVSSPAGPTVAISAP